MQDILDYFLSESTEAKIPKLYHLSFRPDLEGMWKPRLPDGYSNKPSKNTEIFTEPDVARISCSPDLTKCFYAIYPNVSFYFEKKHFPYMEFTIYSPKLTGNEKIWRPEYLTSQKLVHDAHVTDEYCVLESVYMKKAGTLRVMNPYSAKTKPKEVWYYPFDDKAMTRKFLAPEVKIEYELLKSR